MIKKPEPQTQTAIRLPDSFLVRIDKIAENMSRRGMRITRSDALRIAMFEGAAVLEAEGKKK
jgi:predicted transcriptional regulator